MPVIRPKAAGSRAVPDRQALIQTLLGELLEEARRDLPGQRPVIFEMPTGRPGLVNVIVVWEAWKGLGPDARSAIIVEAYDRFARTLERSAHLVDPTRAVEVAVPIDATAIGATWDDVLELDLLPYIVRPTAPLSEPDRYSAARLMREQGAVETPDGPRLRYPSLQLARDAAESLNLEFPRAGWVVVGAGGPIEGPSSREDDS